MTTMENTRPTNSVGRGRPFRRRRLARTVLLAAMTLSLLTIAAVIMLAVAVVTLFRARRFYSEVMAKWLSRTILEMWGVRVEVDQAERLSEAQTIYVSNHSSTLDMFVLVALGLPNTRFVGAQDLEGFLRFMAPLGIMSYVMETLWAPPPSKPAERAAWFRETERLLRRTGDSIYLSPEGERVTTGKLGHFNRDTFQLAADLGAPIVPIYIDIPAEIDPGRGFAALPGTVRVRLRPAISTRDWRLEDLGSNTEKVRDVFVKIRAELQPDRSDAPPSLARNFSTP